MKLSIIARRRGRVLPILGLRWVILQDQPVILHLMLPVKSVVLLLVSVGARITLSFVIAPATIVRLLRHLVMLSWSSMITSALLLIVAIVIVISLLIATITSSLTVEVVLVSRPVVALESIVAITS